MQMSEKKTSEKEVTVEKEAPEHKDLKAEHKDLKECPACCRTKVRSEKEQKDLINRLSRVEGQIRGIRRMLEEDAYCIDIINQVAAANAALNSFTKVILANHIHTCVTEDVQAGGSEKVDELVKTLQKLMK